MAAAMATTAKCMSLNPPPKTTNPSKAGAAKPLISLQSLPKGLPTQKHVVSLTATSSAVAGAIFSAMSTSEPALAAQQIAELAEGSGDNRGLALLLPIIPAIAWVLFNILQPALNQINRMRSTKGIAVGLGLGGLAAAGLVVTPPEASAAVDEISALADAASGGDRRGQLLLIVVTPALLWVLYNILQPALNQLNRMRSE